MISAELFFTNTFNLMERHIGAGQSLPYKVTGLLGKGGFGVVYSGVRVQDGLNVAIKEVPVSKVLEWSMLGDRSVPMELRLLYSCQSVPGVVRLIDFYDRGDYFLYIMEYSPSCRDLFDFISQKGALEENFARELFKQVVDIVIQCYQLGVVHRDIKDENLIIDTNTGKLKLIDFGSGAFVKSEPFTDYDGKLFAELFCFGTKCCVQARESTLPRSGLSRKVTTETS